MSTRLGPTELAALRGVSRQQIYKYRAAGKITQGADGKFDVDEVAIALGQNLKVKKGGSPRTRDVATETPADAAQEKITLTEAQRRHEIARAEQAELKRDTLKGSLLLAADVEKAWSAMISSTRSSLLLLPAKLSHKVAVESDVRGCQALIDREIRAALSGLGEYEPNE